MTNMLHHIIHRSYFPFLIPCGRSRVFLSLPDSRGPQAFAHDASRYKLISDPSRQLHARWGVGTLGWTSLLDRAGLGKVKELQKENIGVSTFSGSYRWQNSGGFAVDKAGRVTWEHIASTSSDMCDYDAAVKTL